MKILLASNSIGISSNPFLFQLKFSLENLGKGISVDYGLDKFFECKNDYDIIHLHWPEELVGWGHIPNSNEINELGDLLGKYSTSLKLVCTQHNYFPHHKNNSQYNDLYCKVYKSMHGIIHMGKASIHYYTQNYESFKSQLHTIIPHGNYSIFPNNITKIQARRTLNINDKDIVLLVFGVIRDYGEIKLILESFKNLKNKIKLLLVMTSTEINKLNKFKVFIYSLKEENIKIINRRIEFDKIQNYLNASDVLLIPRLNALNSGNLILGFTFGLVVVGANKGVVGEILNETGNPTFNVEDSRSIIRALKRGILLSSNGKGNENKKYSKENWNWYRIAELHYKMYLKLLDRS
ncbi:MAG TPA: glycosyltransferase [Bacteroidales bacterium]|nr:glycosyltransferase [Bacteroidales bacterium]